MNTTKRWGKLVALGLGTVLAITACGTDDGVAPPPPTTPPADDGAPADDGTAEPGICGATEDDLVAAAQAEGALTFYGAATENVLQAAADAFSAKYDIPVEFIRMSSSALEQRYNAEAEAGTFVADVAIQSDTGIGDIGFFQNGIEQGWLLHLDEAEIPGYPWDFPMEWHRGSRVVLHVQPWLLGYNTDLVTDPPASWEDVLDEQYRERILLPDPRASGAYTFVWATILNTHGEEWFEGYVAQNPRLFESGVPAVEALSAGEGALVFPAVGGQLAAAVDRGAPVGIQVLPDTSGVEMSAGLTAEAENPCAARLFLAYLMQPEGNDVFADFEAVFSVYDTAGFPEGYVSPSDELAEQRDEIYELLELS